MKTTYVYREGAVVEKAKPGPQEIQRLKLRPLGFSFLEFEREIDEQIMRAYGNFAVRPGPLKRPANDRR